MSIVAAMGRCARELRRFVRDIRGLAASEFGLLLPVMLTILVGTVEVGNAFIIDRKVTSAVQTASDLVAQARQVTTADLNDIMTAVDLILRPFDPNLAGTVIYSVVMDSKGKVSVDWSRTSGTGAPAPTTAVPNGLLQPGSSVIVASMNYRYAPLIGSGIIGNITITDTAYLRPRRQATVAMLP